MKTTGQKIKELRIEKGMSQEELGEKIGVKKAAVNKYETGIVTNLKRNIIAKLSEALDTTPIYLMGWDEDEDEEIESSVKLLVDVYNSLNDEGKKEAIKRMQELLLIPSYADTNNRHLDIGNSNTPIKQNKEAEIMVEKSRENAKRFFNEFAEEETFKKAR